LAVPDPMGGRCLEALPVAALLLDGERRVQELNRVASELLQVTPEEARGRRPGEVIHCATSERVTCGEAPPCERCDLWQAVERAMAGATVVERETVLPVVDDDGAVRHIFLSSAGPLPPEMGRGTLLVLQDITALQRLPGMIAVCARCKQVRHEDAWLPLDRYIQEQSHALFTHTLCPRCTGEYYREMDDMEGGG